LDWAVAEQVLPGEQESGDGWVVTTAEEITLLGAIDGLGHGAPAALAARAAAAVLRQHCAEPLDALLARCHQALANTRGAAITLARVNRAAAQLHWIGVGNVAASLVRSAPGEPTLAANAMLRAGVVGHQLPGTLHADLIALQPGDLLLFGTDGLASGFDHNPDLAAPAAALAEDILTRCATGTDDALILVGRYRGPLR
jgi:hypothetical protein